MTHTMRARSRGGRCATTLATMTVIGALASACGGSADTSASASPSASATPSSSAPSASASASASATPATSDFCSAYGDLVKLLVAQKGSFDVKTLKQGVQKIEDAGLPDGAPSDVADGLKVTADAVLALPDDATQQDLTKAGASFSKDEQAQTQAFSNYVLDQCADQLNLPTGVPSASAVTPSAP